MTFPAQDVLNNLHICYKNFLDRVGLWQTKLPLFKVIKAKYS
jgi:hypothetical protein